MKKTFITILLFVITFKIHPQIKVHKHITTQDGLANNFVHRILKDKQGYMWFGTFNGASRWDGKNFFNITKENGLISSPAIDLIQADDSTIYFSNYAKGVISFKDGVLDTIDTEDGLANNMVIRMRLKNGKPLFFTYKPQVYVNGSFIDLPYDFERLGSRIIDYLEIENGNFYMASRNTGFYTKDDFTDKLFTQNDGLAGNNVDLMERAKDGSILIATSKGPNKYKNGKIYSLYANGKKVLGLTNDVHSGTDGINYYAGDYGLVVETKDETELITTENGLLENSIVSLDEDDNGTIYIGYKNSGVSILNYDRFSNYVSSARTTKYIANSIIQSANGNILLGTQNGITTIQQRVNSYNDKSINRLSNKKYILSMAGDGKGKLAIGTKSGFNIIEKDKINEYNLRRNDFYNEISAIAFSKEGDIIVAQRRIGLIIFTPENQKSKNFINSFCNILHNKKIKLNSNQTYVEGSENLKKEKVTGGKLTYVSVGNGLMSNRIMDLLVLSDSSLVMAFHGGGLAIYKNGIFTNITKEDGLTDKLLNNVFEHSNGTLWIGTSSGGVCVLENNSVIDTIDMNAGLSSNDIRGIAQIDDKIFVTTSNGLNVLVENNNGYLIKQIKEDDGLVSNSCNLNSIFVDNEKYLWIGTNKGITKYNPAKDNIISTPPRVHYSGLQIHNEDYPFKDFENDPTFDHDQNYLKFIFSSINLSSPDDVTYKYKLSGVDKDWVETPLDFASYTNLDDGNYNLKVMAKNEWGYWSKSASLSFVINPAWWETWWFYTLAFILVGSLIAFISSYRYRNLLAIEKMRSKISADLHDSIGSGLTEISILSELLGYQIPAEKKDLKLGMNNVASISRTLIESMSDIVWLVNPKKDTLEDLFKRLQSSYHEVLKHTDIDFSVENIDELENVRLPMNFRQHLYLIFKEAINNAIKYSEGDLLKLSINTTGNNLTVTFTDNGKGFEQDDEKMGNGLLNMKKRAEEIGGKINYFSEINKGTKVKFIGKFKKQKNSFI